METDYGNEEDEVGPYFFQGEFHNGLPRVVYDYEIDDGVMFVRKGNERMPVWSDRRILLDIKKTNCVFLEWKEHETVYDQFSQMVERSMSCYENSERAAWESAIDEQNRYERENQEFVPIIVRY